MEEIDIADAELRFEQLIDEVEQGKSFIITREGMAIVKLQSISKHTSGGLKEGDILHKKSPSLRK